MKSKNIETIICICLFVALLMGIGFPGRQQSSPTSYSAVTYAGARSPDNAWTWTLNKSTNTFSASNSSTGFTYSGELVKLPNGYLNLVTRSTTDPDFTIQDSVFGYEIPDSALIVKSAKPGSETIVAALQR